MPSGWGVDPTIENGIVTSGTSAEDVRKVWGALYSPGIISGCEVKTNTNMTYTITEGVVAIKTATGQVVLSPVAATTIPTAAAPATGTRTDIVWVRQKFPSPDNNSNVVVEVGTTLPTRALMLRKFTVSAGATNTNAAVVDAARDFSIPYGASLGTLHYYQNTFSGVISNTLLREGIGTIYLPTDRLVRFTYRGVHSAQNAVRFDDARYCELAVYPSVDNNNFELWTSGGLHQAWETVEFTTTRALTAGTHTVSYVRRREVGPGSIVQWHGWYNGNYRRGAEFFVEDAGPIK